VVVLLIGSCAPGPEKAGSFKSIFDHYKTRDGIMALSIPPGLVSLLLSEDDPETAELKKLLRDLSSVRMLYIEESPGNPALKEELRTSVTDFTYRNQYVDLFRMQTDAEDMFVSIRENEGSVKEAMLMLSADEDFFVIHLRGNISLEFFTKLVEGGYLNELVNLAEMDM